MKPVGVSQRLQKDFEFSKILGSHHRQPTPTIKIRAPSGARGGLVIDVDAPADSLPACEVDGASAGSVTTEELDAAA